MCNKAKNNGKSLYKNLASEDMDRPIFLLLPHTTLSTIETAPNVVDFLIPLQITKCSRGFYFAK